MRCRVVLDLFLWRGARVQMYQRVVVRYPNVDWESYFHAFLSHHYRWYDSSNVKNISTVHLLYIPSIIISNTTSCLTSSSFQPMAVCTNCICRSHNVHFEFWTEVNGLLSWSLVMMRPWLESAFHISDPLWWESTYRWPVYSRHRRKNDVELWCFLCRQPEQTIEQAVNPSEIW